METTGLIGVLRFNYLNPPFDNPAIRRAALQAVNQGKFMTAVAGEAGADVINDHVGFFAPQLDGCEVRDAAAWMGCPAHGALLGLAANDDG